MAKVVLGLGTSHSPHLNIPPEAWAQRGEEDRRNPFLNRLSDGKHVTYDELMDQADPAVLKELTMDVFQRRHEANQKGIARVAAAVEKAAPDVLIMVGDDQKEVFQDDNMPALAIHFGDEIPFVPQAHYGTGTTALAYSMYPKEEHRFPGAPDLALHLIESMVEQNVDVAHSRHFREGQCVGHAFTFVYWRILQGKKIPTITVMQNTYFPPAQPTPKRSYEFGIALRNAIETWKGNERVAVLATGGLSHFVVDEELDRKVLKAFEEKDVQTLTNLPRERLQSGTSEIRNWITVAAAAQHLDMELFDYVPCYRSPAGTGCAMGFAQWV